MKVLLLSIIVCLSVATAQSAPEPPSDIPAAPADTTDAPVTPPASTPPAPEAEAEADEALEPAPNPAEPIPLYDDLINAEPNVQTDELYASLESSEDAVLEDAFELNLDFGTELDGATPEADAFADPASLEAADPFAPDSFANDTATAADAKTSFDTPEYSLDNDVNSPEFLDRILGLDELEEAADPFEPADDSADDFWVQ